MLDTTVTLFFHAHSHISFDLDESFQRQGNAPWHGRKSHSPQGVPFLKRPKRDEQRDAFDILSGSIGIRIEAEIAITECVIVDSGPY